MTAAVEQDAAAAASARSRADQLMAEAEVAAAERLVLAAELEYNSAVSEQQRMTRALGQVSWEWEGWTCSWHQQVDVVLTLQGLTAAQVDSDNCSMHSPA